LEENLKQRLVGAAVLVALAVIFLPAVFDKDERVAINTTSLIPPAPSIEPVIIPRPTKPETINIPPAQELFQPELVEEKVEKDVESKPLDTTEVEKKVAKSIAKPESTLVVKPIPKPVAIKAKPVVSKPALNSSGVPAGWVVQVASFKSVKTAETFTEKLLKADYKAYYKSVETTKGEYIRVFIGPYINEQQAIDDKRAIDKVYKVSSRVLRFNPASGK